MGRAADPPSDESPEHSHLRIRPADTELSPAAVEQGFCRLHTIEPPTEGWRDRLFGTEPPTIEFRLQRPAGADAELSLYAGIENAPQAALKEALRTACPNAYELTPATPEPVGPLADATAETPPTTEAAAEPPPTTDDAEHTPATDGATPAPPPVDQRREQGEQHGEQIGEIAEKIETEIGPVRPDDAAGVANAARGPGMAPSGISRGVTQ
jgi:hypothetical protein